MAAAVGGAALVQPARSRRAQAPVTRGAGGIALAAVDTRDGSRHAARPCAVVAVQSRKSSVPSPIVRAFADAGADTLGRLSHFPVQAWLCIGRERI